MPITAQKPTIREIADNYPGLLDGIIPGCSFPDVASGTIPFITDARLLSHYFDTTATVTFTEEEQRAVAGFLMLNTLPNVARNAGRIGRCHELFPSAPAREDVAGGPLAGDILTCQLRPIDLADYGATFTADELARLDRLFSTGVCDRSLPGVEQTVRVGTW